MGYRNTPCVGVLCGPCCAPCRDYLIWRMLSPGGKPTCNSDKPNSPDKGRDCAMTMRA